MFVEIIMCPEEVRTRDCHMRQCPLCRPKTNELEEEILQLCKKLGINAVEFELWESTDRVAVVEKLELARKY